MERMVENDTGIYVVGGNIKYNNDAHPYDRYDRELYIPKGYILPDGLMLTKEYARFHEDMAKKFVEQNYHFSYSNDFIKEYKDYMLMRVHALQVMCSGQTKILYCDDGVNSIISAAIASYLSFGWNEEKIYNPARSYHDYIRYDIFSKSDFSLLYEEVPYEKKIIK